MAVKKQLPAWFRAARAVLAFLGCLYIFRDFISLFQHSAPAAQRLQKRADQSLYIQNKYTIVMATHKRLENLERITTSYASGKYASVDRVVVIWQDTTSQPPSWLTALEHSSPIPVYTRRPAINSMNERFRLDSRMRTEAVFMVDDDLNILSSDVELAFKVWQELGSYQRIVGFTARDYKSIEGTERLAYVAAVDKRYSMILSNAAFLHRSFFDLYWSKSMKPYRDLVDEVFNCDDLLINFLVSDLTGQPPLLFQPARSVLTYPDPASLWARPDHFETRSKCLTRFTQMMGKNPLVSTTWSVGASLSESQKEMEHIRETIESQEWIAVE